MKITYTELNTFLKTSETAIKSLKLNKSSKILAFIVSLRYLIREYQTVKIKIGNKNNSVVEWAFDTNCWDDLGDLPSNSVCDVLSVYMYKNANMNALRDKLEVDFTQKDSDALASDILAALFYIYLYLILAIQCTLSDLSTISYTHLLSLAQTVTKCNNASVDPIFYERVISGSEFNKVIVFTKSLKNTKL